MICTDMVKTVTFKVSNGTTSLPTQLINLCETHSRHGTVLLGYVQLVGYVSDIMLPKQTVNTQ